MPERLDPMARARACAAFEEVWASFALRLEDVRKDRSLTPDQRAAALRTLREQQKAEASAAERRVMEEEEQTLRERRRVTHDI